LGNPGIGKSALALRFAKKDFVKFYEPTIEEEYTFRNIFDFKLFLDLKNEL
jgi:GTPase SAR1 family protein